MIFFRKIPFLSANYQIPIGILRKTFDFSLETLIFRPRCQFAFDISAESIDISAEMPAFSSEQYKYDQLSIPAVPFIVSSNSLNRNSTPVATIHHRNAISFSTMSQPQNPLKLA